MGLVKEGSVEVVEVRCEVDYSSFTEMAVGFEYRVLCINMYIIRLPPRSNIELGIMELWCRICRCKTFGKLEYAYCIENYTFM